MHLGAPRQHLQIRTGKLQSMHLVCRDQSSMSTSSIAPAPRATTGEKGLLWPRCQGGMLVRLYWSAVIFAMPLLVFATAVKPIQRPRQLGRRVFVERPAGRCSSAQCFAVTFSPVRFSTASFALYQRLAFAAQIYHHRVSTYISPSATMQTVCHTPRPILGATPRYRPRKPFWP